MLPQRLFLIPTILLVSILPEDVSGGIWHKHWRRTEPQFAHPSPPGPLTPALPLRQIIDEGLKIVEEILDPLVVKTTQGKCKGIEAVSRQGKKFVKFYGIPYAKPPTGDLRFEPPQPAESWNGTLDATKIPPECAQIDLWAKKPKGQDDCLYLNVYAPEGIKPDEKLPVVAHIHGGAFHTGSGAQYEGDYFIDENVVFVNMNYRLGAFGFLDTTDGVVRGNMGLKDQLLALKWIQKNIAKFGGDPDLVTITGASAGSMFVNYHILSLKSKGLFTKAILQSGAVFGPIALNRSPKKYKRFTDKFNCTNEDTKVEIDCLRKIDALTLAGGHSDVAFPYPLTTDTYFTPTIEVIKDDDAFLTEDPKDILKSGNYNKVPIIAGLAEQEMLLTVGAISGVPTELEEAANDFESWSSKHLVYKKDAKIAKKILDFYYKGNNTENIASGDKAYITSRMISDRIFNYGVYKFVKTHSANAPTFLYVSDFNPEFKLVNLFKTSNQTFEGTAHGDDVVLYYPVFKPVPEVGSRIYNLSIDAMNLFSQFVNEDWMTFRTVPWWQVNPNRPKMTYLNISDVPDMVDDPFDERMKFWESLEDELEDL